MNRYEEVHSAQPHGVLLYFRRKNRWRAEIPIIL